MAEKIIVSCLVFCIPTLMSALSNAQSEEKQIAVIGMAAGITAKSRDEAIDDALRQAVEQAMGIYVSSETLVENMMMVEDRIYTETRGYISNYEIIKENTHDGTYQVQVSAQVKTSKLADDLESIGLLIRKKQNPRVMVVLYSKEIDILLFEYIREGNRNIENQIESSLMGKGFEIVDAEQVGRQKQIEAALSENDLSRAVGAAKDFGAEVLITGNIRRMFVNNRQLYGRNLRFYSNEIQVKAIETDSAKVLYSGSRNKPPSAINHIAPLEEASSELTEEMIAGILKKWEKDVYEAARYQLNISNTKFKDISVLKKELENMRGFVGIQTRSFRSNVARLEVKYKGSLEELVDNISQIQFPAFEITSFQSNTIDITINQ